MVEYLYDAIKAVAGQEFTINVYITDDEEQLITENCDMVIHGEEHEICCTVGEFIPEESFWAFTVPAEATLGWSGRYQYCIRHDGKNLCFKQPIYLV